MHRARNHGRRLQPKGSTNIAVTIAAVPRQRLVMSFLYFIATTIALSAMT
jgi:hypothetical protein